MKLSRTVLTITALLASGAACASSLPLTRGDYVIAGQPCRDAPFAAMVRFDGQGFNGPHSSQCRSTVVARSGKTYRIRTQCAALGDGTLVRPNVMTQRYAVLSPTSFTRKTATGSLTYRFCDPR